MQGKRYFVWQRIHRQLKNQTGDAPGSFGVTYSVHKNRRNICSLAAGLLVAAAVSAAEPRAFAAISFVADELRMVAQEVVTGSALNNNPVERVAIGFDLIEVHALKAMADAILRADAVATVAPVKLVEPRYYANPMSSFDGSAVTLPDDLLRLLRQGRVTHLVLLSKHRAEARMKTGIQTLGSGWVSGLGFYVDRDTPMRRQGTGEMAQGFLAPYVYLRLSLIDVATLAVIRTEAVTESEVLTAIGTSSGADPWTLLTAADKIETLRRMVRNQVKAAVPRLLAGT